VTTEQVTIEKETSELQASVKTNSARLYYLQGEEEKYSGFDLKPMSSEDSQFIRTK